MAKRSLAAIVRRKENRLRKVEAKAALKKKNAQLDARLAALRSKGY